MGAGEGVLGSLIDASHHVGADGLARLVAAHAAGMGASEVVIYLSSYQQRTLVPLGGDGVPERVPLEIDATVAGRAFRMVTTTETRDASSVRLWTPLLDGTARLGILEVRYEGAAVDEAQRRVLRQVAGIVAELCVSKNMYGDLLEQTRRRKEMSLAAEIQWELLPPNTFSDGRTTVAGVLEPAYDIAGDSFDYARNGDRLYFTIIDAMGHGFEAALLASAAMGAFRHRRRAGEGLRGFYTAMDGVISEHFGPDRFVTALLGELEVETGRLCWLNAGHPPPLLARGGRVVGSLDCQPTLPAGFGGAVAEIAEERLEPGDYLLFYTDGVVESRSATGEFFGEERLANHLSKALTAKLPAPETVRRLSHATLEHQGTALRDDATMLLISWHGPWGG